MVKFWIIFYSVINFGTTFIGISVKKAITVWCNYGPELQNRCCQKAYLVRIQLATLFAARHKQHEWDFNGVTGKCAEVCILSWEPLICYLNENNNEGSFI